VKYNQQVLASMCWCWSSHT